VGLRFAPMLAQVLPGLCASGVRISLVSDDETLLARFAGTPVDTVFQPALDGWRGRALAHLLRTRFATGPELVHVWGTGGLWWARRWAARKRLPLIVHVLGMQQAERATALRRSDAEHIALIAANLSALPARKARALGDRLHVVPPGIATQAGARHPVPPDALLTILCTHEFADLAGLTVLIDAVSQLRRSGCDLHVALVGGGNGTAAVWRRMRDQGVRACMSLVDDPRLWEKALPVVDVCVVPGCQRELSIVPLLTMALGKIVVSSRDQIAEWFIEDRTTWQFTPGSAQELAYLLTRVRQRHRQAQELRHLAAEYVRREHALLGMVDRLLKMYESAARCSAAAP